MTVRARKVTSGTVRRASLVSSAKTVVFSKPTKPAIAIVAITPALPATSQDGDKVSKLT